MKQVTLNTSPRTDFGTTAATNLRKQGRIPAVIYGESGHHSLSVDAHEFGLAFRDFSGRVALIELNQEGRDSSYAIIQELQRDSVTDAFVHIDFKEIVRGKDMEADIPLRTRGIADGVRNYGGVLDVSTNFLRVRCRPRDLPESIMIDVSELAIGHQVRLSEIEAPEGVSFLDDPETVLAACLGASPEDEEGEVAADEAVDAEGEDAEAKSESSEE